MNTIKQTGPVTLYISHGAGTGLAQGPELTTVDWFIVEPRDDPEMAVASLRKAGRTVIEVKATPYNGRRLNA